MPAVVDSDFPPKPSTGLFLPHFPIEKIFVLEGGEGGVGDGQGCEFCPKAGDILTLAFCCSDESASLCPKPYGIFDIYSDS